MMIAVSGATLAVEHRAAADTPGAILFIHGFPLDHTLWRHQVSGLRAWTRIAPDLRGAGASSVPESPLEYSTARYADDLAELLGALNAGPVVACGLSMGGYVLFELLRRHPALLRAAVFCNTKAEADTAEAKAGRDEMAGLAREQGARGVAEKMLPKMLSPATAAGQPQVVAQAREIMERAPTGGIIGALHALRERADHTATLPTIRVPVLVLAGADDQITPAAGMRRMADAIPGARFTLIEAAGHLTPLEQPEAVNRALAGFLREVG